MAAPRTLELTGILATTDSFERLRLCFVDDTFERAADNSWSRLQKAVPEADGYSVPYKIHPDGEADDAGICGECWVSLPRARARRARLLALAEELRGKKVVVTATPKRFAFVSRARHNFGDDVAGTALELQTLEELASEARPGGPGAGRGN